MSRKYISYVIVAETDDFFSSSTIQAKHERSFYSCFSFRVKEDGFGYVSMSQWDRKLFPINNPYKYSPLHIVVEKKQSKTKGTVVASGIISFI